MQVEEMRDFLSQKKTYEEVNTMLEGTQPGVRGYSVKSIKRFCKKVEFLPGSLKTMREQRFLKQLQRYKRTFTKFTY